MKYLGLIWRSAWRKKIRTSLTILSVLVAFLLFFLLSAIGKANISDLDAFRAALKAADFASVRGDFKFGSNNHPIHDVYIREVIKEGDVYTNKIIGTALENHSDAYAGDCKM